jgi:hypothetical protein
MSYKTEHPAFDNVELFENLKALDPRFEDVSWHNDEVPSLAIDGSQFGFSGNSVLLHVYVDYAPLSKASDYNDCVSYCIKDADEQITEESSCDQTKINSCYAMIQDALRDCQPVERKYYVTPKLEVSVTTPAVFQQNQANREHYARQAIQKVRDMDAEELKRLVIDGLQDADGYPCDFAEY